MSESCGKRGWWTRYSENKLIEVENTVLSVLKTSFRTWFVSIGSVVGKDDKIWTISLNEESKNVPLVLLHGFAAGIGFWCKNFDEIAKDRPVYAIDLLGFGKSSRPSFHKDCEAAEQQWIDTIEEWRKQLKLEKFILLGHSFGGYLATSYAIQHPERVRHLILADPWGFAGQPPDYNPPTRLKVMRILLYPFFYFNPLSMVRAAGPFGPRLVRKTRRDLAERFEDHFEDTSVISEYIYQCNSQYPSGESAFSTFLTGFASAKNPMMDRSHLIKESIPMTVLYGEYSWIDKSPGVSLYEKRRDDSYVNIEVIPKAGHHIYSDQSDVFNRLVKDACNLADINGDTKEMANIAADVKLKVDFKKVMEFAQRTAQNKDLEEKDVEDSIDQKIASK